MTKSTNWSNWLTTNNKKITLRIRQLEIHFCHHQQQQQCLTDWQYNWHLMICSCRCAMAVFDLCPPAVVGMVFIESKVVISTHRLSFARLFFLCNHRRHPTSHLHEVLIFTEANSATGAQTGMYWNFIMPARYLAQGAILCCPGRYVRIGVCVCFGACVCMSLSHQRTFYVDNIILLLNMFRTCYISSLQTSESWCCKL